MVTEKTGPNPTDRFNLGSKRHLFVDAQGIPPTVILAGASGHDITKLDALLRRTAGIGDRGGKPNGDRWLWSLPPVGIVEAHDVVLAEVRAGLHFDDFERRLPRILETVDNPQRNIS
jgi:hypothetical protein